MDCTFWMRPFSFITTFFSLMKTYEQTIDSLSKMLKVLQGIKDKVQAAQRALGFAVEGEMSSWLNSIDEFMSEAKSVTESNSGSRISCLGIIPLNICSTYQLIKKANELLARANELKKKATGLVPGNLREMLDSPATAIKGQVMGKIEGLEVTPAVVSDLVPDRFKGMLSSSTAGSC